MLRARVTWDMATDPSLYVCFFALRIKKFLYGFRASSHLTSHVLMEACALRWSAPSLEEEAAVGWQAKRRCWNTFDSLMAPGCSSLPYPTHTLLLL